MTDYAAIGALVIRTVNAIAWCYVGIHFIREGPLSPLGRRMTATVIVAGMVALAIGGLTPFGFPPEVARFIYTIFTAYALIVALAIATTAD